MGQKENLEGIIMKEMNKVVILTDIHMGLESQENLAIVEKYVKDNKKYVTHIIDMGDGVDNPYMSDFPVDPAYVNSAQIDFDNFAKYYTKLDKATPKAKKILIAGNHDKARLDKVKRLNRGLASLRNLNYENILKESLYNQGANLKNFTFINDEYILKLSRDYQALFTHGDPRLNPKIKGGVTGARRTAEMYPFEGDIFMGHIHWDVEYSRPYEGKKLYVIAGLFDINKMKQAYINQHPYNNSFGVIHYDKKQKLYFFERIEIHKGIAKAGNKLYKA